MDFYPTTASQLIDNINTANNNGQNDNIYLTAGATYTLTQSYDAFGNGLPPILSNITIYGNGATIQRDTSASHFRLFAVGGVQATPGTLTLNDVILKNGYNNSGPGGAIIVTSYGTLSMTDCVLRDNTAPGVGGAVSAGLAAVSVTITSCTFSNNVAVDNGGAIDNSNCPMTITDSTFTSNVVQNHFGGAIHNFNATMQITNCIIAQNTSGQGGSGVHHEGSGSLTITGGSITDNVTTTDSHGAGIYNSGTATVNKAIIAGNSPYGVYKPSSPTMDATYNWWGAYDGPSGVGPGSGDAVSSNVNYTPFFINVASLNEGGISCPAGYAANDATTTSNPISLHLGETRAEATDISVTTPAGPLAFTRTYRQSEQGTYQFMGLGWNHNHAISLFETTNPDGIIVKLADGKVHFNKTTATHYDGVTGSVSFIDKNAITGQYTLTMQDKSIYLFDNTGKLISRTLPNGEVWTYNRDGSGNLTDVQDGYGRALKFVYYSGQSGSNAFKNGQLWRLGDHNTTNLDITPTGRYVEFDYTPEKVNGVTISNPKALLATVKDVLGAVWTYDYYGQHTGETSSNQLNFMTQRLSPTVDQDGDGVADAAIVLESLIYTVSGTTITNITQARGNSLLQTALAFQPSGQDVTTEVIAGKTTTHRFFNGVYGGAQDPAGNFGFQVQDPRNRPALQQGANGKRTQLMWSTDGKHLQRVIDPLVNQTSFAYNTNDTLKQSIDAQGRRTQYTYGDATQPRQPTRVKVIDEHGVTTHWQEFTYDSKGRTLTEKTFDPANGTTVLAEVDRAYYTSGNGNGLLQTLTRIDPLNSVNNTSTVYTYDNVGRVVKAQQTSMFGSCQFAYTVYDSAGNVVATVCGPQNTTAPTTIAEAIAMYDANDSIKKNNHVTTYQYDTLGRRVMVTVNAGATFAQTSLTAYDALNRVVRTISNYVADAGVPSPYTAPRSAFNHGTANNQNLVTDTAYNTRGMVRSQTNLLGQVTLYGYDDAGRLVKMVQSASQPSYNNDYSGTSPDPSLSSYTPSSNVDLDIIASQAYDKAGNLVKTVDPLGNVNYTVYDALNRVVKTVRNAKAAATIALNPGDPGYNAANDPRSNSYVPDTSPDRDQIETMTYDAMGRVVQQTDTLGRVTYAAYDTAGRVSRAIANYVAQGTSDPANWVWSTINNRWERGATDSTALDYGANNDQNIVTGTTYDAVGRVLTTQDILGRLARPVYDGLGRAVKNIANYVAQGSTDPANWVWSTTNNRWEDGANNAIDQGTGFDQNQTSETNYDSDGRVHWTRNAQGQRTWYVYDSQGRQVKAIVNCTYVSGTPAPEDDTYTGSNNPDEDIITRTVYDDQGRVQSTFDALGKETRSVYDVLGRRIRTIANYVVQGSTNPANWIWSTTNNRWEDSAGNPINQGTNYDQNLIGDTIYDLAGRAVSTRDTRGTQTTFSYDNAGRRLTVTQAASSPVAVNAYTNYDKAGRVLRSIANYIPLYDSSHQLISPDARDGQGNWLFNPTAHGQLNDQNLITTFTLDAAGRQTAVADPLGNTSSTSYFKDGSAQSVTDPEGTVSQYRYDNMNRQTRVIQSHIAQGNPVVDPANWVWSTTNNRWERSATDSTAIVHGVNNDQNIIVLVAYDKAGRMTGQREPRGNLTSYGYDRFNRRLSLTNPLSNAWQTAYANVSGGTTRTTLTNPNGSTQQVQRDFDKLGRLKSVQYLNESPKNTPDVSFIYDKASNRLKMSEYTGASFTNRVRETTYGYDQARRLNSVGFDNNGDGTVDQTVSYQYDVAGRRTQLTLPGSLNVTYTYDARGRLVSLTDWDSQQTQLAYDNVGRQVATFRPNRLRSRYVYDAAGRLKTLRHDADSKVLAHFAYEVDRRGNRTQGLEALAHPGGGTTTISHGDTTVAYKGTWTDTGSFHETTNFSTSLSLLFFGWQNVILTVGEGPDHSIYDVYVGPSLWQSVNGYAASAGTRTLTIPLDGDGPFTLELRNRAEKDARSTGYKLRFQSLAVSGTYDAQTIKYTYDALARLLDAKYYPGQNTGLAEANLLRRYQYAFDRSGNRTQQIVTIAGTPTTTNYSYNAGNQLTGDGVHTLTYDNNGNLTSDGTNTYSWDRANRLLSMGGAAYGYDGAGNRVQQTVGVNVTQYLLDVQPGLAVVLAETVGANTARYVHGPRGIHARKDAANAWHWEVQDGLGSVRMEADNNLAVEASRGFAPYGDPFAVQGTFGTPYEFTGELKDSNELLYLRARYLNPGLGVLASLDPVEGATQDILSLNRYSYVAGNPTNGTDPSGLLFWSYPTSSRKNREDPGYNTTNRPAHAWIEKWLEFVNGFWTTQLEFPGGYGTRKIDAVIFQTESPYYQSPLYAVTGSSPGYIYEIEPAYPEAIVEGFEELGIKFVDMLFGTPPFSQTGILPDKDYWDRSSDLLIYNGTNYASGSYNWNGVRWALGPQLGPLLGVGPYRVDPSFLGAVPPGINAWWIYLIFPGLILYVSERTLTDALGALGVFTADQVLRYILDQYDRARQRPDGAQLPVPGALPGYAYALEPINLPSSPLWQEAQVCNNGLCANSSSGETALLDIIILLLGTLALAAA